MSLCLLLCRKLQSAQELCCRQCRPTRGRWVDAEIRLFVSVPFMTKADDRTAFLCLIALEQMALWRFRASKSLSDHCSLHSSSATHVQVINLFFCNINSRRSEVFRKKCLLFCLFVFPFIRNCEFWMRGNGLTEVDTTDWIRWVLIAEAKILYRFIDLCLLGFYGDGSNSHKCNLE